MTSTIEYSTDGGTSWTAIDYTDFSIERGNGKNLLAPNAVIDTHKDVSISTDDLVRIKIDSTRRFEGYANGPGVVQLQGQKRIEVRGYGYDIMEEKITLNLTGTSPENVLSEAISGTDYTLTTTTSTGITLDYSCDDKKRKNVFQDMVDRTGYIFRVEPDKTIYFEDLEDGGSWQTLSTSSDKVAVREWNSADPDTIKNKVIVNGTGESTNVKETATDFTYTDVERSAEYNFKYISTSTEAQNMADQLLEPSPLAKAKIIVGESGYTPDIYSDLVNSTIDLSDSSKGISNEVLVVEKQKVKDGRIELELGEGSSFSIHEVNLQNKSDGEKNDSSADATAEQPADTLHPNRVRGGVYNLDLGTSFSDFPVQNTTDSDQYVCWMANADVTLDGTTNAYALVLNVSSDGTGTAPHDRVWIKSSGTHPVQVSGICPSGYYWRVFEQTGSASYVREAAAVITLNTQE